MTQGSTVRRPDPAVVGPGFTDPESGGVSPGGTPPPGSRPVLWSGSGSGLLIWHHRRLSVVCDARAVHPDASTLALVAATGLHAGFQLVVTAVVYPAFSEVSAQDWPAYHAAHSRRITGVVVVVYVLVVAACGWVLTVDVANTATTVAIAASGLAILATATLAAPAHRRLAPESRDVDLVALRRADYLRCAATMVAAVAATWAALR